MKITSVWLAIALAGAVSRSLAAEDISLESAPPVVVKTVPVAGATAVDPGLTELRVTFSKAMQDGSWSWTTWGEDTFPETTDKPQYDSDGRTCVLPVKLQPGKFYATWLNSDRFKNFKDSSGLAAVPYLLTFQTADKAGAASAAAPASGPQVASPLFNADQKLVVEWTDRQFRGFFDLRAFDGWSAADRTQLEAKMLDSLKGPQTREYFQAINTLGAMRSPKAVPPLLEIAADRREKNNRERWMAIRALGLIGDKSVVPELVHLVYHGNVNTRWWAQISLVQLTGTNFGNDWKAWGKWWNQQGGRPEFNPAFVQWYKEPELSDPNTIQETLAQNDEKFLAELRK